MIADLGAVSLSQMAASEVLLKSDILQKSERSRIISRLYRLTTMGFLFSAFILCLFCLLLSLCLRFKLLRPSPSVLSERQPSPSKSADPRISQDPALIRPEYDVVIVGSGYGGGVAASRLARAGKRVCVLERGAEIWPGQFPHTLKTALQEYSMKDLRPGKHNSIGNTSGLYQTYKGKGQDVFTGCGLGGTSLINAGVFLRADQRILEGPEWPVEIRENSNELKPCKKPT